MKTENKFQLKILLLSRTYENFKERKKSQANSLTF